MICPALKKKKSIYIGSSDSEARKDVYKFFVCKCILIELSIFYCVKQDLDLVEPAPTAAVFKMNTDYSHFV